MKKKYFFTLLTNHLQRCGISYFLRWLICMVKFPVCCFPVNPIPMHVQEIYHALGETVPSEGVNSPPSARGSVRYGADCDFHIHLSTFLWQLRSFVERIIRKRLSDSFIRSSAMARLSASSSCVSHHGQRLCQTFLLQFRLLL